MQNKALGERLAGGETLYGGWTVTADVIRAMAAAGPPASRQVGQWQAACAAVFGLTCHALVRPDISRVLPFVR